MKIEFVKTNVVYKSYGGWTFDTDNYPELKGLSAEEVMRYIEENAENMEALNTSLYANLYEELNDEDLESVDEEDENFYGYDVMNK
jgi:hypothetical protein